jgi:hypothetical protein
MTDPPSPHDPLLSEVALSQHDVEPELASRIRSAALAHFDPVVPEAGLWTRVFEPALVVVGVLGYLTWTAQTLASLHAVSHDVSVAASARVE